MPARTQIPLYVWNQGFSAAWPCPLGEIAETQLIDRLTFQLTLCRIRGWNQSTGIRKIPTHVCHYPNNAAAVSFARYHFRVGENADGLPSYHMARETGFCSRDPQYCDMDQYDSDTEFAYSPDECGGVVFSICGCFS